MSLENFSSFASCLNEISQSVRKITLNKSNLENNFKIKTDDSPVTKYDIEAENYIRKYLENSFPSHNIIGEELKVIDKKSEFTWIIDPIDGTKSYMSGRPLWGTMIGLLKNNALVLENKIFTLNLKSENLNKTLYALFFFIICLSWNPKAVYHEDLGSLPLYRALEKFPNYYKSLYEIQMFRQ